MAGNEWRRGFYRPVAPGGMQICMAHPAGFGFYENLARARRWNAPFPQYQRFTKRLDNGGCIFDNMENSPSIEVPSFTLRNRPSVRQRTQGVLCLLPVFGGISAAQRQRNSVLPSGAGSSGGCPSFPVTAMPRIQLLATQGLKPKAGAVAGAILPDCRDQFHQASQNAVCV